MVICVLVGNFSTGNAMLVSDNSSINLQVDYNTGMISVSGKTNAPEERVSILALNPESGNGQDISESTIAFVGQTTTNSNCEYDVEFSVEQAHGTYALYLSSPSLGERQENMFVVIVPELKITRNNIPIESMVQLEENDLITITASGFDFSKENKRGSIILAQYRDNVLIDAAVKTITDEYASVDEVLFVDSVKSGISHIEVFYFDMNTLCPLIGSYKIRPVADASQEQEITDQEYEINYQVQGDGRVSADVGFYGLDVFHTADSMSVKTVDGEKTFDLGAGEYSLTVRSGNLDLSRNGAFEQSVTLPRVYTESPLTTTGVTGLSVTSLAKRPELLNDTGDISKTFWGGITKDWSLEFEKTGKDAETIEMADGSYKATISIGDTITVETAPLGGSSATDTETIYTVQDGHHHYRFTSQRGIAQLFVDGKYAASVRLPKMSGLLKFAKLTRKGAAADAATILRTETEWYTFADDFEGTKSIASTEYWIGDQAISIADDGENKSLYIPGNEKWMNVFTENFNLSGKMKINGNTKITFRRNSEAEYMAVGYNCDTNKWELHKNHASDSPTETLLASADGSVNIDEWFNVNLNVDGNQVTFHVNGTQVLSATIDYTSHGSVGIITDGGAYLDDVKLEGDGMVRAGVIEQTFDYYTVEFIEIDNNIYMTKGNKTVKSTDRGRIFSTVEEGIGSKFTSNTILLHDGSIVSIGLVPGESENTYWDEAWISNDNGATFSGPYRVETRESNRITMNNKLIQTTGGRVIFCAGESGHGNESEGKMAVYYSDDGGYNWSESETELSYATTGVNVLEGKVIEMPDKTLKCFMRTDRGYIYTSESKDNGETWSLELEKTQLPISSCAMNIERDPSDPSTYYMVYEYENTNEDTSINYPRWRTSLAVSYDGCETWEYVTDLSVADVRVEGEKKCLDHMNQGLRVFDDCVMVSVALRKYNNGEATETVGKVWRVDKEMIRSQKRMPLLYNYGNAE